MTDTPIARVPLCLTDPGALVAALPALLGFRPERSVVAVVLDGVSSRTTSIDTVVRQDLDSCDDTAGDFARALVAVVTGGQPTDDPSDASDRGDASDIDASDREDTADRKGAGRDRRHPGPLDRVEILLVVVDDRLAPPGARDRGAALERARVRRGVTALARSVRARGLRVAGVFTVARIERGQAWRDESGDIGGRLADPRSSPVAAARVWGGGAIHGSRRDLERVFAAPAAPHAPGRSDSIVGGAAHDRGAVAARPDATRSGAAAVREIVHIVTRAADRRHRDIAPGARELDALGAVVDCAVRDAVLGLVATDLARAAEEVWIAAARVTSGSVRTELVAMAGFCAYARGDGPLAGIAVGEALRDDPAHRLAGLLDRALRHGIRPAAIRALAEAGHDAASEWADLPARSGQDR